MRSTICLFLALISALNMVVCVTLISPFHLYFGLLLGIANTFALAWNLSEFYRSLL